MGTDLDPGSFDEDLAAAIVAKLAEMVPVPTEAEARAYRARRDARERELDAKFEGMKGWEG